MLQIRLEPILPAQRYVCAVYAMVLYLSVCLSVCHKPVSVGWTDQAGFGAAYLTLYYKDNLVYVYFPLELCLKLWT